MKLTTIQKSIAAVTVAGVGLVAGVVPAGASTTGTVATFTKTACNRAINERLFILTISENRIESIRRLTADQKAAEIAGIEEVKAHLVGVNRPALAAAVTRTQIRSACQAIYADNRVYAV